MADDAEARRRARASWPIRKVELGDEPSDDLSDETTVQQRLEMMWPLALRAYSLAGHDIERRPRAQWPGRVIRDWSDEGR